MGRGRDRAQTPPVEERAGLKGEVRGRPGGPVASEKPDCLSSVPRVPRRRVRGLGGASRWPAGSVFFFLGKRASRGEAGRAGALRRHKGKTSHSKVKAPSRHLQPGTELRSDSRSEGGGSGSPLGTKDSSATQEPARTLATSSGGRGCQIHQGTKPVPSQAPGAHTRQHRHVGTHLHRNAPAQMQRPPTTAARAGTLRCRRRGELPGGSCKEGTRCLRALWAGR